MKKPKEEIFILLSVRYGQSQRYMYKSSPMTVWRTSVWSHKGLFWREYAKPIQSKFIKLKHQ